MAAQAVFGAVFLGLGGLAYWAKRGETQLINAIETAPVLSVAQIASQIDQKSDIPLVQIKARTFVPPADELKAPVSKQSTSAFVSLVDQVAEVRSGYSWNREQENLSRNSQGDSVFLKDATSDKVVRVPLSSIEEQGKLFETASDRFELKDAPGFDWSVLGDVAVKLGGFDLSLGASANNKRILGYNFREKVIPQNRPVYALGRLIATDMGGIGERAFVLKPMAGSSAALVTFESQDQVKSNAENREYWWNMASIVSGSVGSALVVSAAVSAASSRK